MTGPLLRRASLRYLRLHPLRFGLAALGIALGVALAVGIDVAIASVRRAFALSSEAVVGDATHEIVGAGQPVTDSLYRRLRLDPALRRDVALMPVVTGTVALVDRPGENLQILGVDPFAVADRGPATEPRLGGDTLAALVTTPGAAVLGRATAARLRVGPAERLLVRAGATRRALLVAAIMDVDQRHDLGAAALVDVATAQELLGLVGSLSRIEVRLYPGRDVTALQTLLPAGVELRAAGARQGALLQLTRGFELNLGALSLLGLFVGGFLIHNTISVSVAQRRGILATLRILGVTRGEIGRLVLLEAALLGLGGAVIGVALGVGLGRGLVGLVARAVNDLYFAVAVTDVEVPLAAVLRGGLLGTGAALLSALSAARTATRAEPRAALGRSAQDERSRAGVPWLATAGAVCSILVAAVLAASERSLPAAFVALVLVLLGAALLAPGALLLAARLAAAPLGAVAGLPGRMAARNAGRALSRTGVAVAALMLAISVSVGVTIMVGSFRLAVAAWLGDTLQADVYVSAPSLVAARAEATLPEDLRARLSALPGVAELGTNRTITASTPAGPTMLIALDLGPRGRARQQLLARAPGVGEGAALWDRLDREDAAIISEPLAWKRGLSPGDSVTVTTAHGPRRFAVLGVFRDYGSDAGVMMLSRRTFERHFVDRGLTAIALYAAADVAPETLLARVRAAVELAVRSSAALRAASLEVFDRTFEVTGVLRLLALLVAGLGVAGALMTLELERARELGTLRALGFTRRQVSGLLGLETGFLGLVAGLLAAPLGAGLAALMVFVINRRSFGWSMPIAISATALLAAPALGLLAGLLGGVYPAWRLARTAPSEALREE